MSYIARCQFQKDCQLQIAYRVLRHRTLETVSQKVLTCVLLCGTPARGSDETLPEYLLRHKGMTRGQQEMSFEENMKIMMKGDTSWRNFNIPLLYRAITFGCEGWQESEKIHTLVTGIRDHWKAVVHEVTKDDMTKDKCREELEKMASDCFATLKATREKYTTPEARAHCDQTEAEVTQLISEIKVADPIEVLKNAWEELRPHLKREADQDLKERLENATSRHPLYFHIGTEKRRVEVTKCLSEMMYHGDYLKFPHHKLLKPTEHSRMYSSPHVIIVEGEAGMGKTAIITYTLTQYLKEGEREMEVMDQYDVLFWIVCRDWRNTRMETLLETLVPLAYNRYGRILVPLMLQGRVLFVLEGFDEASETYYIRKLTEECKNSPNATFLVSTLPGFIDDIRSIRPTEYWDTRLVMKGVRTPERNEMVLDFYRQLCGDGPRDEEGLNQLLSKMSWRPMFLLPMSLFFLVTMFREKPKEIMAGRMSPTRLYQHILDWCTEKLRQRLAGRSGVPTGDALEAALQSVLTILQRAALMGIVDKLFQITDDDLEEVANVCNEVNLPLREVLAAFYCVEKVGKHEQYGPPLKEIQEFFAALHLQRCIQEYQPGDIHKEIDRCTQECNPPNIWCEPEEIKETPVFLDPLKNTLVHLLVLLSNQENPNREALKEILQLLNDIGMKYNGDWLSTVEDTDPGMVALEMVAEQIDSIPKDMGHVNVREGNVEVLAKLMPLIRTQKRIRITILRENELMKDILTKNSQHKITELAVDHELEGPVARPTSGDLLELAPR